MNKPPETTESKKKQVIAEIFRICRDKGNYEFDNQLVKKISNQIGFTNPFDATKIDNSALLPQILRDKDYYVCHLGKGRHCFVPGIENGYHRFEEISEEDARPWKYKKSLLNEFDTSESNILSVAHNQSIIHDFLYENDRRAFPNVYNARRTKCSFSYKIGHYDIVTTSLQMEIDLTLEYEGQVTVFEGKNKFPDDFAIYQLYHPFLYYHELREAKELDIRELNCCYLLRDKEKEGSTIRVYLYTFTNPYDMTSIKLIRAKQYNLSTAS